MNILVTGLRIPASLDLAKNLHTNGNLVYGLDSLRFPFYKGSRYLKRTFWVPAPSKNIEIYAEHLIRIIREYQIDLLIPTCEDIFYVSHLKSRLDSECHVFCDSFQLLKKLHHKYEVFEMARDLGVTIPQTYLLDSRKQLEQFESNLSKWIFKPVFSRFASEVLIAPSPCKLNKINLDSQQWVAQEYIEGIEYSSYSIARQGNLNAHCCYQPSYRLGKGAGIYFIPHHNKVIQDFVSAFIKKHHFTGQIGFDFIVKNEEVYLIECNPRITSGLHFFIPTSGFDKVFTEDRQAPIVNLNKSPKMISSAMLLLGWPYGFRRRGVIKFANDYFRAKNVISYLDDPGIIAYHLLGFLEMIFRSLRYQQSFRDAVASDIEWNGEVME